MNKKYTVFYILFTSMMFLTGCGGNKVKISREIAVIDISKNFPKKEFSIQELGGELEYIPLETNDNVLLGRDAYIACISDNRIIVINPGQGDVFVFGRNGKIISQFNHKGPSGEEYNYLKQLVYDEQNREFFVIANKKIIVYSEDGQYKRSLPFPEKTDLTKLYNFDGNTLFGYDEYGILTEEYSTKPYLFISKKDGSIVSTLEKNLPQRYSNQVLVERKDEKGENTMMTVGLYGFSDNWHDGNNFTLADISADTIFQLTQDKRLIPLLIREPSVHDTKTFLTSEIKTDKFILLNKVRIDFEKLKNNQPDAFSISSLIYDFANNLTYEARIFNADCEKCHDQFGNVDIAENSAAELVSVTTILKYFEEGTLKGSLKQLAETLNEEDNPVVATVKFK
jgi:hypothetical protein